MAFSSFSAPVRAGVFALAAFGLAACANHTAPVATSSVQNSEAQVVKTFEQDRAAILAMVGDYKVTFDFRETVSFKDGYDVKEPKLSGGHEMVRVIEDTGTYIALQHILIVGDGEKMPVMPIKHWRQDWIFEPTSIMEYAGANIWQKRELTEAERAGKWAQVVYQVDDAPRYAAVAAWDHSNGSPAWTSPKSWRPLPRRDATKRDDYHTISAVNRHAITPNGWVHEQDNAKIIIDGDNTEVLVHEIGLNTYKKFGDFRTDVGTDYWEKTEGLWTAVRAEWDKLFEENDTVALTILGEPQEMYMAILGVAADLQDGKITEAKSIADTKEIMAEYITTKPLSAGDRLTAARQEETASD